MDKNSKNKVKTVSFGSTTIIYIPPEGRAHWMMDKMRRIAVLEVLLKDLINKDTIF